MNKSVLITASAVLVFSLASNFAIASGKDQDTAAMPFQVALDLVFDAGSSRTIGEPITFGNSTAVLQYIACEKRVTPSLTTDAAFQLTVDIEGGGSLLILDSSMEPGGHGGPGYTNNRVFGAAFVSACVGKKCNSLGEDVYESFTVSAWKNDYHSTPVETMTCTLTGMLYQ